MDPILPAKAVLGLCGVFAVYAIMRHVDFASWEKRNFDRTAFGLLAASRLGLFVLVFAVFQFEPTSDVRVYYAEANAIYVGGIPFVDINTAYGPLFDYVLAAVIAIWNDPAALILFTICLELFSLPVWLRVGRASFEEATVRRATVLYVCNTVALANVAIAGENQVWLSLFLGASLLALSRDHKFLSGIYLGASVVVVKFLSLLFAPIFFLATRFSLRWGIGFVIVPLATYATILMVGGQPLDQVYAQAADQSSGNIPYLLTALNLDLTNGLPEWVTNVVSFAILCLCFLFVYFRFGFSTSRQAVIGSAFLLVVVMLVSKKAYADYIIVALFPLCLAILNGKKPLLVALIFSLLTAVATVEPSLWFRWMELRQLDVFFEADLSGNLTRTNLLLFFACELVMVTGYLWLLALLYGALGDGRRKIAISKHGSP